MASSKKGLELTNLGKTRFDLQKEILTTLFNASEEPEEELPRRRTVSKMKRSGAFGQLVSEPFKDMDAEDEKHVEHQAENSLDGNCRIIFFDIYLRSHRRLKHWLWSWTKNRFSILIVYFLNAQHSISYNSNFQMIKVSFLWHNCLYK